MSSHAVSVHLARAPRARPSRSPPGWDPRALRATTRRLRPPRARAARPSTALASTPGPARASGDGTRVFAPPLSVYPIPDKEWSAPGADDGELEVEPWEAQPSPFAPAPTPEYAPSRPSEFDPARRAPEAPAPPAPEGDPLRPYEPRPDETSMPAPLVPDPEQRPAREPPAAPPPSGPGPVLVPPESTPHPKPATPDEPNPSVFRPLPSDEPGEVDEGAAREPWRPRGFPGVSP